jgi:hypothetical protein
VEYSHSRSKQDPWCRLLAVTRGSLLFYTRVFEPTLEIQTPEPSPKPWLQSPTCNLAILITFLACKRWFEHSICSGTKSSLNNLILILSTKLDLRLLDPSRTPGSGQLFGCAAIGQCPGTPDRDHGRNRSCAIEAITHADAGEAIALLFT